MKGFILKCAAVMLLLTATMSVAAQNNLPQVPYIEINASAQRKVTPDEIYLTITIKESDYKGKKTLQQMQQTMVDILKKNKVNIDEQLTVLSMGSGVKLKNFSSKIKTLTTAQYLLKLDNVETMQNIISGLEEKEISNIVLSETKYSKTKELEAELGVEAVKNAKQKAIMLATAIGQEAGKAIYINTWGMNSTSPARNLRMNKAMIAEEADAVAGSYEAPRLSIAETEYTVTVNARFELK
jgi:uncharacterized protein YggE